MSAKKIPNSTIIKIIKLYTFSEINKSQISKALNISRETVRRYIICYEQSNLTYLDLLLLRNKEIINNILQKQNISNVKLRKEHLIIYFEN